VAGPARADIGVFGGSGFYEYLDDVEEVDVDTPYGPPAAPIRIGVIGDRRVAFLPRHGRHHEFPPHAVPYRANVAAFAQLGARAILSPFAAGSLDADIHPGDFVVVDQFVDRTSGRTDTFYDRFTDGPRHVSVADPYDAALGAELVAVARELGISVHAGGTVVVIQGPRFSTRAESRWFRGAGWHVVNMTQYPEVVLAAEAGVPFVGVALVTDYDTELDGDPRIRPVTQEQVFDVFRANVDRVRDLLAAAIPRLPLADG
jgi:5'-methylthioadenosine phosphorylase